MGNGSYIGDGLGGFHLGYGSQSPRLSLDSSLATTIVASVPVSMPCLVQAAGSVTTSATFTLPSAEQGGVFILQNAGTNTCTVTLTPTVTFALTHNALAIFTSNGSGWYHTLIG